MKNIIIIGFMGAGKSAVGRQLSKKLKLPYTDTDRKIEKNEKMLIRDIFEKKGESYFRSVEKEVIRNISRNQNTVISVGGGAVLDEENTQNLKNNGFIIYLKAPFEILYDRIKESTNRPLISVHNPEEEMQTLLEARQMVYESIADLEVDVSNRAPEEIAEEIAKNYENQ